MKILKLKIKSKNPTRPKLYGVWVGPTWRSCLRLFLLDDLSGPRVDDLLLDVLTSLGFDREKSHDSQDRISERPENDAERQSWPDQYADEAPEDVYGVGHLGTSYFVVFCSSAIGYISENIGRRYPQRYSRLLSRCKLSLLYC